MDEMADAASNALRYQAANEPEQAKKEEARVQALASHAAASAPPKAAAMFRQKASAYGGQLSLSGAGSQPERKALSAEAAEDSTVPAEF
jgi:hypothetical protein